MRARSADTCVMAQRVSGEFAEETGRACRYGVSLPLPNDSPTANDSAGPNSPAASDGNSTSSLRLQDPTPPPPPTTP